MRIAATPKLQRLRPRAGVAAVSDNAAIRDARCARAWLCRLSGHATYVLEDETARTTKAVTEMMSSSRPLRSQIEARSRRHAGHRQQGGRRLPDRGLGLAYYARRYAIALRFWTPRSCTDFELENVLEERGSCCQKLTPELQSARSRLSAACAGLRLFFREGESRSPCSCWPGMPRQQRGGRG